MSITITNSKVAYGPKIVSDGLVLYLDSGNAQSYPGEPTTNLVTNPTNEIVGTTSEFLQLTDLAPIFDTYGTVVTYSLSLDIKSESPGSMNVYMQNGSTTKYSFVSQSVQVTTEYQRFTFDGLSAAISTPTDTQAKLALYGTYGSGRIPSAKNIQVEINPHTTPFTATSRLATNGLKDLVGNNNGDLTNMSYDSSAQLIFTGAGDISGTPPGNYIGIPQEITRVQNYPNGVTYDIWINPDVNERRALLWGSGTIRHMEVYCGSAGGSFRTEATLQNGYSFGASAPSGGVPINTWTNITVVWAPHDIIRPVYWYKNGILFHTHTNFHSGTGGELEDFYFTGIGRATGNVTYLYAKSWSGKVDCFKIYSKSLSQPEILQNFNTTKSRFGL
jgi:hypothetical protein